MYSTLILPAKYVYVPAMKGDVDIVKFLTMEKHCDSSYKNVDLLVWFKFHMYSPKLIFIWAALPLTDTLFGWAATLHGAVWGGHRVVYPERVSHWAGVSAGQLHQHRNWGEVTWPGLSEWFDWSKVTQWCLGWDKKTTWSTILLAYTAKVPLIIYVQI